MRHIKLKNNYTAYRKIPLEEYEMLKQLSPSYKELENTNAKEHVKRQRDWPYETVIYCYNCKKMNPRRKFLKVIEGEEYLSLLYKTISLLDGPNSIERVAEDLAYSTGGFISNVSRYCKNITEEEIENLKKIKFKLSEDGFPEMICPCCGKKIESTVSLSKENWLSNIFPHSYEIKEEGNKFSLSIYAYIVFPNTDAGKIKYENINIRLTFNNETKNVYAFPPIYMKNGKPVFKDSRRILKITHMAESYQCLNSITKGILEYNSTIKAYLADYICKKYGTKKSEVLEKPLKINDIFIYFRYPSYSKEARDIIKRLCHVYVSGNAQRQKRKRMLLAVYEMQSSPEKMQEEMRKKKIPNKKRIKKMICKNPFIIYVYRLLTKMGFKDYNVITDIIEKMNVSYLVDFIVMYLEIGFERELTKETKRFITDFVKARGDICTRDSVFYILLLEDRYPGLRDFLKKDRLLDCGYIYCQILDILGQEPFPIKFKDYVEMHDDMSRFFNRINHTNRKIPYYKEELEFNDIINGFNFILPQDTYSLVDCGEKLGICVGTYGSMALKKDCTIVFMLKDNKYCGCLELVKQGDAYHLAQAKRKFNNLLEDEAAWALKEWVETHEIVATCYDYQHIEKEVFKDPNGTRTFNYAQNPVADVDVINKNIFLETDYLIIEDKE